MKDYQNLKVGFIGCGKIAHFHADVFKYLGLTIESVCYKTNRENAESFAKKYNVSKVFSSWRELIDKSQIDFLWVIPSWDQIDLLFEDIIETGIPAFFEKPLALNPQRIQKVLQRFPEERLKAYQVGFNRRFYNVVAHLKTFLEKEKIVSVFLDIPEPVNNLSAELLKYRLIQNSSHIFDLLFYLFGNFEPEGCTYIPLHPGQLRSDFIGVFRLSEIPINVNSIWNAPQNYCMRFYTESEKVFQLSPFEELTVFNGFTVVEPTEERPIRQYKPGVFSSHVEPVLDGLKPGFMKQTENFLVNALENKISQASPTMLQSYLLIKFLADLNSNLHQ